MSNASGDGTGLWQGAQPCSIPKSHGQQQGPTATLCRLKGLGLAVLGGIICTLVPTFLSSQNPSAITTR